MPAMTMPTGPTYTPEQIAAAQAQKAQDDARKAAEKQRQEEARKWVFDQSRQVVDDVRNRQAPQMQGATVAPVSQFDTARSDQFRAGQMGLLDSLGRVASGQQQGAGELAVQRQAQRAIGNAAGAATMARGNSAVGGARAAARASGAIGLGAAGQAQQAALGDQASARQQIAGVLGQGREQDIGIAGANMSAENQRIFQQAGLDQATSVENMHARLKAIGMNDEAIANAMQTFATYRVGLMNAPKTPTKMDKIQNAVLTGAGYLAGGG